ncbi:hypothetical protein TNCV_3652981 [Trichonephila clavipes]|nr:hypothetical protein TNCV_3652981 [Trichonephila clavipes]
MFCRRRVRTESDTAAPLFTAHSKVTGGLLVTPEPASSLKTATQMEGLRASTDDSVRSYDGFSHDIVATN